MASIKLTKIATENTKAKAGSINSIGIKPEIIPTGKVNFHCPAKVINKINKKLEREITAETIIRLKKVFMDKENTKS